MAHTTQFDPDSQRTVQQETLRQKDTDPGGSNDELGLFRTLKPYIGHCLTLNHDINNPLAGIIGYCEFLLETADGLDEAQKGYLQQVLKCAERIKKRVENLCEDKIALAEQIDLRSIIEAYQKTDRPLD